MWLEPGPSLRDVAAGTVVAGCPRDSSERAKRMRCVMQLLADFCATASRSLTQAA